VHRLAAVAEQMNIRKLIRRTCAVVVVAALVGFCAPLTARATIVRFSTAYGNIDVRLYNTATPLSVANFVNYMNSGRYAESIIHRSIPGFIIQGGGYYYPTPTSMLTTIPTDPPVLNEFGISNLRGTLAYAKLGASPPTQQSINSATSGWFFNLANNASNLDNQNGGFTVFGRVVGNGMTVVDTIAGLGIANAGSPFDNLPVVDLATVEANNSVGKSDLVFIHSVTTLNFPKGDYNFDGVVNGADYTVWKNNFGSMTAAEADGNGDGKVNAADYTIWRDSLNQTGGPGSGAAAGVPEPSSGYLLLLASPALWIVVRRRIRAGSSLSFGASSA
jgi:peptidyl-prolyl cis-trans isomerase A (cyclophilin A)